MSSGGQSDPDKPREATAVKKDDQHLKTELKCEERNSFCDKQTDPNKQRGITDVEQDVQNLKAEFKNIKLEFERKVEEQKRQLEKIRFEERVGREENQLKDIELKFDKKIQEQQAELTKIQLNLLKSFKSEVNRVMAYATFSTFGAGVIGAILGTSITLFFQPATINTTATISQSQVPAISLPWQQDQTFKESLDVVNKSLNQCLVEQKESKEVIEKLSANMKTFEEDVKNKVKDLVGNATLREYIVDEQMKQLEGVFVSKEWLFVIVLMGLFEVGVVFIVWKMWQKLTDMLRHVLRQRSTGSATSNGAPNTGSTSPRRPTEETEIWGEERILNQIRKGPLQKRVCVVAFHSETIDKHVRHAKELLSQNSSTRHVTICQFLVCSHDDVLQLPPSRIYLVFVDFNERNVILEDPHKGLGNLRLTAVQAMRLMGAEVVLTYSRDQGSNNLTSGDLYNHNLKSVEQHPELRHLDRSQRMLSVMERFNQSQCDHIVKIVKSSLT